MKYRTVVMYTEIGCFVACVCGWILVCSTLVIQYWRYSDVGKTVLTNAHTYSNLWKDCLTDSTGMTDCKDFPTLLGLDLYVHICRALVFSSVILGFFGHTLALVGMKCTKLGGSEITNAKITFAAGMTYLSAGLCAICTYSWYGNRIILDFMDPNYRNKRFELGTALYVGWGGSALLIPGGIVYSILAGKEACCSSPMDEERLVDSPYGALSSDMVEPIKQPPSPSPSPSPEPENEKKESLEESLGKSYSKGEYV